jgi:hypothetical protein
MRIGLLLMTLALWACGEKPSFYDEAATTRGANANPAEDEGPVKEDGGETDVTGVEGDGEGDGGEGTGDGEGDGGEGIGDDGEDDGTDEPTKLSREMTFPSHLLGDGTATQDLDGAFLEQQLTLIRQYFDRSRQVRQVVRPVVNNHFDQGHSGAANTETFDQVANRPLDILVVVDNSASMEQEQNNLAGKLAPLLNAVVDTDWQIGVVTTDPNQNCLRKLIRKGDADAANLFRNAVTAGINGSGNERGVLMAVRSLSGSCLSQRWIRDESTLAVLFVTDEDNCSNGTDCGNNNYGKASYLYDYLAAIREPGKNARVYGIFWHPSQDQTMCPTALNKANIYADLVSKTNGTWGSICDADYSATLTNISQNILVVLNSRFTLRYMPDPGTLRVFVDTQEVTTGWTLSGKVVEFATPPADGALVTVSYRYGAVPIKSTFPLNYKPLADRVKVVVDGVEADPATYTVNTAAPAIEFMTPPAERAKIAVTFTRDVPLTSQWLVGDNVKPGSMTVKVDGVVTTDFTVTEAIGLVSFNPVPPEGAYIDFIYTAVGPTVTKYPFSTTYGAPKDLVAFDSQTAAPVRVSYTPGFVTVNSNDYVEGRMVTLRYDNVPRQRFSVDLPQEPVVSSVVISGGSLDCKAPYVTVTGTTVNAQDCGFADDVSQVAVGYQFVVESYQEFTFAGDDLPGPKDWQEWHVFVDDEETTEFTRDGNKITFAAPLPVGSMVKIQLIQLDK